MFLTDPATRHAVAAAIVAVLVFYFPQLPQEGSVKTAELILSFLAGLLIRAPGDGMAKPLTRVIHEVVNPRPAGE